MSRILIYTDKGAGPYYLRALWKTLKKVVDPSHELVRVKAKDLLFSDWEKGAQLLIFPGGMDVYYDRALRGEGTDRIKQFVSSGGNFLGICAGGYFGAERIDFERGRDLEVIEERDLGFYPGLAKGPALGLGKFQYFSEAGAEATCLSWKGFNWYSYYNGGCFYQGGDDHPEIEVLARYLDLVDQPAAVIERKFGRGKAILSGVHFECDPESFSQNQLIIHPSFDLLIEHNCLRKEVIKKIFQRFSVKIIKNFLGSGNGKDKLHIGSLVSRCVP